VALTLKEERSAVGTERKISQLQYILDNGAASGSAPISHNSTFRGGGFAGCVNSDKPKWLAHG
jgi:hypothetical protein